jgi:hypothetical protein
VAGSSQDTALTRRVHDGIVVFVHDRLTIRFVEAKPNLFRDLYRSAWARHSSAVTFERLRFRFQRHKILDCFRPQTASVCWNPMLEIQLQRYLHGTCSA